MPLKSLKINFTKEGASLNFESVVRGFESTKQNAIVNLGTQKGSDKVYPEKGTGLMEAAFKGAISGNAMEAGHQANFAASDTLFFMATLPDQDENEEGIEKISIEPTGFDGYHLRMKVDITSNRQNESQENFIL